jgi:hypothetical protein
MFDVLKPPTDNLYKFLALTGLLLLIISVVLPGYALFSLELKRLEALKELNLTKAEIEKSKILQSESESAKHLVDAANLQVQAAQLRGESLTKKKHLSRQELKELKQRVDEVEKAMNNLRDATKTFQSKSEALGKQVAIVELRTVDNEYQGEVLESINLALFFLKFLLFVGIIAGGLIAMVGFGLWYRKVQVFEDIILKLTATEMSSKEAALPGTDSTVTP